MPSTARLLAAAVVAVLLPRVRSFLGAAAPARTCTRTAMSMAADGRDISRSDFLLRLSSVGAVAVVGQLRGDAAVAADYVPLPRLVADLAEADLVKESYQELEASLKVLSSLDFYIAEGDFFSLRSALRKPPFSTVRKAARKILGKLGVENQDAAAKAFASWMTAVERLDSLAGAGMREAKGLSPDQHKEMLAAYDNCMALGKAFMLSVPQEPSR